MEELFRQLADRIALAIEVCAVFIVTVGAIEAFVRVIGILTHPGTSHGARKETWRRFGMWLLLGLEFELAADIIRSVIAPTWQEIVQLGAIAAIRTFLNYFLEKDLEHAEMRSQESAPW